MYFNFQNMAALCDNNAEKSKFRFSRSPCGDARYLVIPCNAEGGGKTLSDTVQYYSTLVV